MKPEEKLQAQIASYLRAYYPDAIVRFDSAGLRFTYSVAKKHKKFNPENGYPDMFVAEPNSAYSGLFIELKADTPFRKDGKLKKDKHLQEQQKMLHRLKKRGYAALFGVGLEGTKAIIDNYMAIPK